MASGRTVLKSYSMYVRTGQPVGRRITAGAICSVEPACAAPAETAGVEAVNAVATKQADDPLDLGAENLDRTGSTGLPAGRQPIDRRSPEQHGIGTKQHSPHYIRPATETAVEHDGKPPL